MFFVHQRGSANGYYMICVNIGVSTASEYHLFRTHNNNRSEFPSSDWRWWNREERKLARELLDTHSIQHRLTSVLRSLL